MGAQAQIMTPLDRIYVIDPDSRRRAQIAKMSYEVGLHAEPCQDLEEFSKLVRQDGYVLTADNEDTASIAEVMRSTQAVDFSLPASVYSENPSPDRIVAAMLSGALDYHVWPLTQEDLKRAVTMTPQQISLARLRSKQSAANAAISQLSPRELDVLKLMTRGHCNKVIAIMLGISPRTVEIHRANLLKKLPMQSTSDAIRIGIYAGLDED